MPNSKGFKHSTRKLLKKSPRKRGLQSLGRLLVKYNVGDQVVIKIDAAIQKGMPHRRYHGKFGVITEVRGRAYVIKIKTGDVYKQIIARPEHVYITK
ncbi:MAG TPA: 50S ribosomal protein L21e [Candidatus Bathyarchaeia archaeon]|nr:50S ribosomal protein L21e [Candidatus Bathyarchaeia archaeon]